MMISRTPPMPSRLLRLLRSFLVTLGSLLLPGAGLAQNTPQQLTFAGLRSVGMQGQINAVKTDAAGNLYLLLNQGDGVRLLKTDPAAKSILAQALLGAKGDTGLGLALDPAGNLYVTGTTTSGSLSATPGAAIAAPTDTSTQSFVAKFDANLSTLFVSFTGGSKIAASAVAATADSVFVTGVTYAANLPVTATAIQQAPAPGSSGNGFVERFSASGATLVYATYLTGAGGDTNPAAIVADTSDNAYLTGSTSASGFPTVAALVFNILSHPSGFLTRLTPAGDNLTFSTFIPGPGLTAIALDPTGNTLLLSGAVALGQFPVDTVQSPVAAGLSYQTLLRIPIAGTSVLSGTLLVPGTQSFVVPDSSGGAWVDGSLGGALFPFAPLADTGSLFAVHVATSGTLDQIARFGGLPNQNPTFASLPTIPTSIALDPAWQPIFAGAIQPTASVSLLASETYDLALRNAPTAAFPSTVAGTAQTAATCNQSECAGSAAYLARLSTAASAPALSFSVGDAPFVVLRNLGSTAATGLNITSTTGTLASNCPSTLGSGALCNILLSGGGGSVAGTLTAASATDTQSVAYPAFTVPASTIAFFPKELDFGIATATSPQPRRTLTVTNLGGGSQTFNSAIATSVRTASPFTEAASDCPYAGGLTTKILAPGATCHITLAFAPGASSSSDGYVAAQWSIGSRAVALTAYSQAASLSASAAEIGFGTQYAGGLRLPRYLYLSNSSTFSVTHASIALPASSPFSVTDGCPSTLIAGSVCRIRVDYFSATVPSSDAATLALDGGISVLLTGQSLAPQGVSGTSVNPNLSVSPTAIEFANTVAVTSVGSETQTVTIANTGSAPFALTLAVSGDFLSNTSCAGMLAGNSTCAVALTFAPSQPGTRTGILSVTAGPATSPAYVALSGTASAIIPANNGALALGASPVGQPKVQFFRILQPLNPFSASTTGPFTVALVQNNGFTPVAPSAGAFATSVTAPCPSCFLAIQFLPTATGPQTGTLTLASAASGNPYTLVLTGSGTANSGLLLSPTAQDFGSVPVHSSSGAALFTLTNDDPAGNAVTLPAPVLSGDYVLVQTPTGAQPCAGTLAYGASCELEVAAAPAATGARPGTLTLATASASLTTTATSDPGLAVNPLALSFSNTPGPSATSQTVALTNTGPSPLAIGPPATAAPFSARSDCATLAPASTCSLTVNFTPTAALATGTLTFSAGANSYSIALSGNYTSSSSGLQLVPGEADFGPSSVGVQTAPRIFTVNNLTTAQQTISVAIPRQFVLIGPPCTTLGPGGSCSFSAAFLPLDNGPISASFLAQTATASTIAYGEGYGNGTATLTLAGGLIASQTFNFGQVTSGHSAVQTFTLTNTSAANSLTIRRITSPPPFAAATTCDSTLLPGAKCTVTITYVPTNQVSTGTALPPGSNDAGALTIESDAASSPDVLNLTGQAGPVAVSAPTTPTLVATFSLSQGSLSFPVTTVGNVSPAQTLTLTNTGTVTLNLSAINASADYTATSTCTTILPANSCLITVSATPQTPGPHVTSLEISSNAATALEFVSLVSASTANPLTLSPTSLTFGSTVVGTSSALPVQVTNSGSTAIVFNSIATMGDYMPAGSCPAPGGLLPAGQSCTIQVTFDPTTTGARTGLLLVATSASANPLSIALTGTGVQSKLTVAPTSLAFGSLVLGASANLNLTVSNGGSAPVSSLVLTVTGDFSVSLPCPAVLLAGQSCTAQITFTPTALGVRSGTLRVASSDPSSPLTVPLTGTAIHAGSFTLSVDGAASSTVSVKSGGPATYHLTVTPTGTFAGSVALTCAPLVAAQFASCAIAPAALTLNGTAQTSLATINTITSADGNAALTHPRRPMTSRAEKMLCLLLPGTWLLFKRRRRLGRWLPGVFAALFLMATLAVSGCGGQGGDFNTRYTPPGTYAYQVTATSTSGIQVTQTVTLNLTVTPR